MNTTSKIFLGIGAMIALPVAWAAWSTFASAVTAPSRVINKTLETNNIIHNYEWFHDTNAQYRARQGQIRQQAVYLADEQDQREKQRLRAELMAMQQTCRELVERYNANAVKTNRSIFMGKEAPERLNAAACE